MAAFTRQESRKWHDEVPGARWFRADLHLHTLDDHPGSRVKIPPTLAGPDPSQPQLQKAYARLFLQTAIARDIQVLGLTPHAVRSGASDDTSATWRIVEVWNDDNDDDGIPFRDKIYAVLPGFEPSLSDGARGVHLLFLFDPEIGRDCYIRAFHAVMGGASPWDGPTLRNSGRNSKEVFDALDRLKRDEGEGWDFICLAPHAFSKDKGLFGELKGQILQDFPSNRLAGLELGDNHLPDDQSKAVDWLQEGIKEHRHAFFHSSDAYNLNPDSSSQELFEVGSRVTLVKLAAPKVEALRQAFLASDSRLRIVYKKNNAGQLVLQSDLPDPLNGDRPWLRSISVVGGTAFFGGYDKSSGETLQQTFPLNPDLTCIIGGRMTGKSTFLDGLRVHFKHELPSDEIVRTDVTDRAQKRFLSGNPTVDATICGGLDPTLPALERWPAQFFTQRELQNAVRDQSALRTLVFQLAGAKSNELLDRDQEIRKYDNKLQDQTRTLARRREILAEAEQAFEAVSKAKEALTVFESAGAEALWIVQADNGQLDSIEAKIADLNEPLTKLQNGASMIKQPELSDPSLRAEFGRDELAKQFETLAKDLVTSLQTAVNAVAGIKAILSQTRSTGHSREDEVRKNVARKLAEAGRSSEELNRFDALSESAGHFEVQKSALEEARKDFNDTMREFDEYHKVRQDLIASQSASLAQVATTIQARFQGRIRYRVIEGGIADPIEEWINELKQRGITRWWNDAKTSAPERHITPAKILAAVANNSLDQDLGMTEQVATTFKEVMTEQRQLEVRALRCDDRYILELRVEGGSYRPMNELSGGQQVSLLLSLLLEGEDTRPLVIDQPEDELDKTYLFNTVLPTLRRLKGRRQIVFATHDANIVVNGDADHVIYLRSTSERGWVHAAGAIESPPIKDAILTTLDGGEDAFTLRQAKYGF